MRRRSSIGVSAAVLVAALLCVPTSAMAAVDVFLAKTVVKGESTAVGHLGDMDILSWSWGASTGTARTKKGVLPAGCIQDLNLAKVIDTASPELIMNSVRGEVGAGSGFDDAEGGGEAA